MPKLSSEEGGRQGWKAAKRDRCVEVVEEVMVVEGEDGDEEEVEEIIVEEVEVIEEEEDEDEDEDEEEGDGEGAREAGEEDMEFSDDERGESDPGQLATTDGRNDLEIEKDLSHLGTSSSAMEKLESSYINLDDQKGSSKCDPPCSKLSTSLRGDSSCDVKHSKSGESKVASGNVEAKDSVVSEKVGAAHQEKRGPTHSNKLFPDYPGRADRSLTAKHGVTHLMSQDLSYRIAHGFPDFKKDLRIDLDANKDDWKIASRSHASVTHPRDSSPHGVLPEGNKRQAVICAFFAKGWCIRGKSCRFLHVKDDTGNSDKRDNSTPNSEAGDKHREGLGNDLELKSSGLIQSNCENGYLSANTDAERWSAGSNDKGASSESFAFHGPSSSVSLVSTYRQEFPSSYASALTRKIQYMNNISSPISNSWNQKVKPPLNSKVFTPDNFSARVIPMKDLDSLSSSASPLEQRKVLDVAYCSSSLLQCQSSLSGSALDNVLLRHKSADSNIGSGHGRFSAYDWEPSEPFRPSFIVSSTGRFSLGSQYDLFLDSTKKHDKEDGALGPAYASHGASFSNAADEQVGGNLGGSLVRECENEDCSGSSHSKCSDCGLKKDNYGAEREKFSGVGEIADSFVKRDNKNVKNDLQSDNVKDTAKDRVRHKLELDGPHKMNCDGNRESRAQRNFKVYLIELVKELLRPTWEKGLISKEVHNSIVKKSVEKVLNTFEPQSIPPSEESTKQYLSMNERKIAKMIEGYVEKYGKS